MKKRLKKISEEAAEREETKLKIKRLREKRNKKEEESEPEQNDMSLPLREASKEFIEPESPPRRAREETPKGSPRHETPERIVAPEGA